MMILSMAWKLELDKPLTPSISKCLLISSFISFLRILMNLLTPNDNFERNMKNEIG